MILSEEEISEIEKRAEARSNWHVRQHSLTAAETGKGSQSWSEVIGYPETAAQNQIAHCADDDDAQMILAIPSLISTIRGLQEENGRMKEALKPFAALSKMLPDEEPDNTTFVNTVIDQLAAKSITLRYAASDLRRAAALHSKISGKE